jgi:alanine dehydrogenase
LSGQSCQADLGNLDAEVAVGPNSCTRSDLRLIVAVQGYTTRTGRTSAIALNNATVPFALKLAILGAEQAMARDEHLCAGPNIQTGQVKQAAVAIALGLALG